MTREVASDLAERHNARANGFYAIKDVLSKGSHCPLRHATQAIDRHHNSLGTVLDQLSHRGEVRESLLNQVSYAAEHLSYTAT